MGGLFEAAMRMCDDCDRDDRPLSWSRDGYTKICDECKEKRGDREKGPSSARAYDSMAMETLLKETKK